MRGVKPTEDNGLHAIVFQDGVSTDGQRTTPPCFVSNDVFINSRRVGRYKKQCSI